MCIRDSVNTLAANQGLDVQYSIVGYSGDQSDWDRAYNDARVRLDWSSAGNGTVVYQSLTGEPSGGDVYKRQEMKQRISLGNEKDILVLISKTGETKEVIRLAEIAKKKGIQVIAITNMTKNSLSTLSDLHLKILSSRVKTRLQAYASSVELIYVIDSLILLLYKADYAKYRGKVEKYIEVVREKQE